MLKNKINKLVIKKPIQKGIVCIFLDGKEWISNDISGHKNLSNLSLSEFYSLLVYQNFKCPLSNIPFRYDNKLKKYIDTSSKRVQQPSIDHDHETGLIRGLLAIKLNFLEGTFSKGFYGDLECPNIIKEYRSNSPASQIGIKVIHNSYKSKKKNKVLQIINIKKNIIFGDSKWLNVLKKYINKICIDNNSKIFKRQDLIKNYISDIIIETNCKGKTPNQILSRCLQDLRDIGYINFVDRGVYSI